jgi:hypothetical protein
MILKDLPKFETEKELFDHIIENEETLFAQAKMAMKEADGLGFQAIPLRSGIADKSATPEELLQKNNLQAKLAINTTNVIDSHLDLHVPKMWDKSLKENKKILHLKEHSRKFADVISRKDNLKAYTETVTWKSLGFDFEGKTEVLTFDANILKEQNEGMFKEYAKGNVDEHSVGMQYVKMVTCINDEDYPVQKENFDKYIEMAVNKDSFTGKLFWAVTEAKVIEGSAVLMGSNSFTPTQSIKSEPKELTPDQKKAIAVRKWLNLPEAE